MNGIARMTQPPRSLRMKKGTRTLWQCLLVASGAVIVACGGKTQVSEAPVLEPAVQTEYRIGPGDDLQVFVWNHPELTVTVPVRPDGLISTPLVENLPAEGKTPSQLSRDLEKALAEYVRSPTVNVIVTSFVGAFSDQVRVVGQAQKPQSLPYRANMTLLDVMIAVGGLAEYASGNRAAVVRQENGKQLRIPVRLTDLLNDGDINANMTMRPGDVLIIPESRF
jgi:polysaccharide export outer membrane protein